MTTEDREPIEPGLKQALKRAFPLEPAPARLRDKLEMAMAAELALKMPVLRYREPGSVFTRPLGPKTLAAAAAVIVLASGLTLYIGLRDPAAPPMTRMSAISPVMASEIIQRHDRWTSQLATTAPTNEDFKGLRTMLAKQLSRPVWVSDLTKDGWTFRGASVAQLNNVTAAELVYTRGVDSLSMLSFAGSESTCVPFDDEYELANDKHNLAGFATGGQVFCLVGFSRNGTMSLKDVKALRDRYRSDAVNAVSAFAASVARPTSTHPTP